MLSTVTPGNTSREHNESALPRAAVELQYLSLQCSQLTAKSGKTLSSYLREPPVGSISDDLQQLLDAPAPDGGDDTQLGKIGAD